MPEEPWDKRYLWLALVGLLLLGSGLAVRLNKAAADAERPSFAAVMPSLPRPPAPVPAGEPDSRLYREPERAAEVSEKEALDWLLSTLDERSKSPEQARQAEAFREELRKDPVLTAKLAEIRSLPRERRGEARSLLASVARMREFRRLVGAFVSGAGTSARLASQDPPRPNEPGPAGRQLAPVAGGAARRFLSSTRRSHEPGRLSRADSRATEGGGPVRVNLGGGGSEKQPSSGSGTTQTAAAGEAPPPGAAQRKDSDSSKSASRQTAHDVERRLDTVRSASGQWDVQPNAEGHWTEFLRVLEEVGGAAARKELEAAMQSGEDLWGACYVTGRYDLCRQVCSRLVKSSCGTIKTRYWACRSGDARSQDECVRQCTDKAAQGCEVPRSERAASCARAGIPCDYCETDQAYGPPKTFAGPPPYTYQPMGCGLGAPAAPRDVPVSIAYRDLAGTEVCNAVYLGGRVVAWDQRCSAPLRGAPVWKETAQGWVMFFNGEPAPAAYSEPDASKVLEGMRKFAEQNPGVSLPPSAPPTP